jgi:hypothetical protein
MKTRVNFPHCWTETEDCWITLPDGVKRAAKSWLPDIGPVERMPYSIAVLPYRKRDIYLCAARRHVSSPRRRPWLRLHARGHTQLGQFRRLSRRVRDAAGAGRYFGGAEVDRRAAMERWAGRHVRYFVRRISGHTDGVSPAEGTQGYCGPLVFARPLNLQSGVPGRQRAAALHPLVHADIAQRDEVVRVARVKLD